MKTYKQKPFESHILSSNKGSISDPVQFMRIRLNDDLGQNDQFKGVLGEVRTSKDKDSKRLPRSERIKYTPKVVKAELKEEEEREEEVRLDVNEDIVFEGHGRSIFMWFGRTMEGKNAKDLAKIVFSVVEQFGDWKSWSGRVVLLGCRTAPMVEPMAKLLKEKFKRGINVVGTNKDIKGTGYGEPYVYYKNDKGKKQIDFTNPEQVKMAIPELPKTKSQSGSIMLSEDRDQIDIEKWSPQPESSNVKVTKDGDFDIIDLSAPEKDKEEK